VRGPGAITIPAACTEMWRDSPSMLLPNSTTFWYVGLCATSSRSSGTFSAASRRVRA